LSPVIAAILFCISSVAVGQFAFYYWRASIACTATRQVSDRVRVAAGIQAPSVSSRDFRAILAAYDLTPDLTGHGRGHRAIRAYYTFVEKVGRMNPLAADWAEAEMVMCTRYAAAVLDERIQRNSDSATQMRGM
jgi:hypothetical protein